MRPRLFQVAQGAGARLPRAPVDRELAKEAWGRLRTAYYKLRATRWEPIGGETPWAEREFGNPLGGIGRARVK
jgi:hypothetical protein